MRTYGNVNLENDEFLIECEPHVTIKIKRVFAKVNKGAHGVIKLAATNDVARDLEWFADRYPLDFTESAKSRMQSGSEAYRERIATVESLLSMQASVPDFGLAEPLRDYQQIAAEMAYKNTSLLLADDVGLGKTASSIGLLARGETLPALVVTLTHLPKQWQKEINRFAPHLSTHIIQTGQVYDIVARHCRGKKGPKIFPDVVIISYSKISKWADVLAPLVKTVIYDEAQELRKSDSQRYSAAKHISDTVKWRMADTATPIYNYGAEIFNVLECVAPGVLGTRDEFLTEWCTDYVDRDKGTIRDPKAFGAYMRESGLMLRRTRKDVGRELKALNKFVEHIDADLNALNQVTANCAELARAILREGEQYRGQKMQLSGELDYLLRQATGIAKAPFVAEFVRLLLEGEEKVVLYGWHREVYSIWLDKLKEYKPVLYTGSESPTQKEAAKAAFIAGESRVLCISLRAGAGLDGLQHVCRTVVFGELDWSPGVHEQCEGRIQRDGQKDPVFAYYLVTDTGSDPIVSQVCGVKKQQVDGIKNDNPEQLFEKLQVDSNRIKDLARDYLARHEKATENTKEEKLFA